MSQAEESLAVAHRFLAALNACDGDTVKAIYAPDARIWHNFDDKLQSVEDNVKTLHWMHRKLSNLAYKLVRLEPWPGGYLQQHELTGELENGEPFRLLACAICTVENGRITALEEYLDSAQTRVLSASAQ